MPALSTDACVQAASDLWRLDFASYCERISNGVWQRYAWLDHVCAEVTDAVLNTRQNLIIEAPPRHGKTFTIAEWLPVWFLDLFPDKHIILCSYAEHRAKTAGRRVRDTIKINPEVWVNISDTSASNVSWETMAGGGMRCAGINGGHGGGITGEGWDVGIIDDYNKDWEEASSAATQEKIWDWYTSTFSTRAQDSRSMEIVMATRWNAEDLIGRLKKEQPGKWKVIRLPALAEEGDLLGREEGEALCPERWPAHALRARKEAVGSQVFNALYQQRPSAAEGNIIKREWIKYYGQPGGPQLPKEAEADLISWDMNFKETKRGSYVVGQVWAKHKAHCYLLHQVRDRWNFVDTKKGVVDLADEYPTATAKLVEDKANGPAILSELKDEVPGLIAVEPRGSKEARLQSVAPMFEAGNVWVPHPSLPGFEWVQDWIEELVTFPNAGKDDQTDATSQALDRYRALPIKKIAIDLGVGLKSRGFEADL